MNESLREPAAPAPALARSPGHRGRRAQGLADVSGGRRPCACGCQLASPPDVKLMPFYKPTVATFVRDKYWPLIRPAMPVHSFNREHAIVRGLVERWGSRQLASLKPEDLDCWWADLRARVRPATSNRHLVRVKHFFGTATRWRYLASNPVTHIRKRREPRGRVRYLEPVQLAALLMAAPLWLRRYIVVARYAPAGRRSDIHALRRQDLDLEAGTLTFPHTKNGDSVTTPLHARVRAVLSPLPKDPDAPLLRQIAVQHVTRAFHKLCAGLGLRDFHFHDLRHDAGSALGMAGVQQRGIMEVLGHRDPRMSIRYTHLSSAAVRAIMDESL
jgi:integrase